MWNLCLRSLLGRVFSIFIFIHPFVFPSSLSLSFPCLIALSLFKSKDMKMESSLCFLLAQKSCTHESESQRRDRRTFPFHSSFFSLNNMATSRLHLPFFFHWRNFLVLSGRPLAIHMHKLRLSIIRLESWQWYLVCDTFDNRMHTGD